MAESSQSSQSTDDVFTSLLYEIFTSPLNLFLLVVCAVLVYKIFRPSDANGADFGPVEPPLPKMKRQDLTLDQLKQYNGTDEHGRVCVSVNGKIFDVTRGKKFYGPGGRYSALAGRDATRALATFSVDDVKDSYDDLSDLSSMQMDSVLEWEMQFTEKYDYIGKLLKPGEQPTEYSDEEDATKDNNKTKKDE
ncbi:hypothetical protein Pcinc_035669 [Petrolisthes cinctipes]|uniref:Cytochrome b5 heme-binding domain-containing protein n=1 Tax=Petrolisthes cinctipes TaxID=88211 RepID=A0AAE1END4_PETCI|nr:hypothetical protein Pcinc_040490 [Petrolisthes cinctipes]KAK3858118.1 hypothetical protein Pcinc_035669 [Petrolisthes cinctipes]